jgi:glutathione S-transferase
MARGRIYSLADICNFAIANGMEVGFAELVNKEDTPHLVRWIEQINAGRRAGDVRQSARARGSGPPKD